jgi:hypothetical protein
MGSKASAVSSYGFPEMVLGKPTTSPDSAKRKITDFPVAELVDNFTRP